MKKILVIEDNLEIRENLVEILGLSGYQTKEAVDGIDGVRIAKEFLPDLIICDIMMPRLDGYGVLKILDKTPVLNQTPFIFLTAKADKEDLRKGMVLGADDYITKPFDDVQLLEVIEIRLKKAEKYASLVNKESGIKHIYNEAKALESFQELSQNKEVRTYNIKSNIYREGEYPKWLFYIAEGNVRCYQTNELGKELTTHIFSKGDYFGYLPLIQNKQYSDSAIATSDCTLQLIPNDDFQVLLYNDRDFSTRFLNLLANDTIETESKLIQLAYGSVRKKVATSLVDYSKKVSSDSFHITRDELASLAGVAKETTIRTLSDFKSEKLVEVKSGEIILLKKEELEKLPY